MSTVNQSSNSADGFFGVSTTQIISLILIIVIAIVIERIITRYLSYFSKRAKLELNTANQLTLTFRILILIGALLAIGREGLSADLLISISAVGGAALGFASQKTIGNFIAGLYLLAARPFKVGDYVKIGTVEGIAQEITLNYAKVLTSGNTLVAVSNLQLLDRDLTNYLYETTPSRGNVYCYTFEIGFDHLVPTEKLSEIFDAVFAAYKDLPERPFCTLVRSTAIERVYMVYFYVTTPSDIFTIRPQIADQVFRRWDEERAKLKK